MFAKLIDSNTIERNPPRVATIDGALVTGELPEAYLNSLGWYRLHETPAPTPAEGCHVERRYAYDDAEAPTRIIESWVEVADPPAPPREFSKRRLYRALDTAGVWAQTRAYMEAQCVWEDWAFATTLDEDDPLIVAAIAALKTQLGLTDEQVEQILVAASL